MKRLSLCLVCVFALLAGCKGKHKEVSAGVKAEAASLVSEAQFATQIREHARAQELFERAIKLRDDVPDYWVGLGLARRKQDNKDGARKAYKEALALHKEQFAEATVPEQKAQALAQQAWVLALLGRTDEALKLLDKGLKDYPDSPLMKKMADPRGLPRTFQTQEFKDLSV